MSSRVTKSCSFRVRRAGRLEIQIACLEEDHQDDQSDGRRRETRRSIAAVTPAAASQSDDQQDEQTGHPLTTRPDHEYTIPLFSNFVHSPKKSRNTTPQ